MLIGFSDNMLRTDLYHREIYTDTNIERAINSIFRSLDLDGVPYYVAYAEMLHFFLALRNHYQIVYLDRDPYYQSDYTVVSGDTNSDTDNDSDNGRDN